MLTFEQERMRDGFDKWHIGGMPFPAVIHIITKADIDGLIHDHPFKFRSIIMKGGYREKQYQILADGQYRVYDYHRKVGDSFIVEARTIHEIVELPEGDCYTLILPEGEKTRWGFYEFKDIILRRFHDEPDFKPLIIK